MHRFYLLQVLLCLWLHFTTHRQLKHPNIVSLMGYTKNDDEIILIMNYVDGNNLDRLLFDKREKREVCTLCVCIYTIIVYIILQFSAQEVKDVATKIA